MPFGPMNMPTAMTPASEPDHVFSVARLSDNDLAV